MFDPIQRTSRALWWAAILFFFVTVADSWFRWKTFQYQTFDLAFYVQGLWQALRGQGNVSLLEMPIMGNHAEPIVFLLLPFFWIWKHPMTLVVIQAALLATMPFTANRIATFMEFGPRAATGLAIATLLAPAAGFGALHEFHPETLAAPFILLMIEARIKGMGGLHFLWFLLALACKENVALMLGWMGVVHFVLEKRKGREWQTTMNIIPAIVAFGWVLAYAFWLGPKWNGGRVDYGGLYSHLTVDGGMLKNAFTKPGLFFTAFWQGLTSGNLVWGLLLPFILLPVLRLRWMIIAAPLFLQHLLSWRSSEWQIYWHYGLPLLPIVWIAATEAAARLFWRDAVATYILAACVAVQIWFGPVRAIGRTIAAAGPDWQKSRVHADLLATISPSESVTASLGFLSHLAKREDLQSLQLVSMGLKTLGGSRYIPRPTEHVLVDYSDDFTFSREAASFHPKMRTITGEIVPSSDELMHRWLVENSLWPVTVRNSCAHFVRSEPERTNLATTTAKRVDDKTQLVSVEPVKPADGDVLKWKLIWEFGAAREFFPWVKLALRGAGGETFFVTKGPALPGVASGQFAEVWTVRKPGFPPGKYNALLLIQDPLGATTFKGFALSVGEVEVK
ncbi:MAG: hypothetical protein RL088_2675 [Verrucomicrobiota bacterium]|jgi:uncharacterized membrane protein